MTTMFRALWIVADDNEALYSRRFAAPDALALRRGWPPLPLELALAQPAVSLARYPRPALHIIS